LAGTAVTTASAAVARSSLRIISLPRVFNTKLAPL